MLNKLINIEEVERKPFKRHFIRNVVLELSFNDLNKETLINNKEKLQSAFKQLGFVKFGEMKQIEFKMTVDKDTPEQIKNEDETIGLLMFDDSRKIRIELFSNRIIISIFKYLNFDIFIDDIMKMIDVLKSITSDSIQAKSVTLSKQNTIISTDTKSFDDLTYILNKPLLQSIRESLSPFENFEYTKDEFSITKENYKCLIGSNCVKRSNVGEYEINLNISVIDNQISNFEQLTEVLKDINNFIFSLFCWATTEKFKSVMNEEV